MRAPSPRPRGELLAFALMVIAGALALWQLRPQDDPQLSGSIFSPSFPTAYVDIAQTLFYFPYRQLLFFGELSRLLASFTALAMLTALVDRPKLMVVFVCALGWLMYLYHVIWFQSPRHSGIVLAVIVMCLWLSLTPSTERPLSARLHSLGRWGRRIASICLAIGLGVSCYHAAVWAALDWQRPFSAAPEVAAWIRAHVPEDRIIVGDTFCGTVSAHLGMGRRVWLAARREFGTFHTWSGVAIRQNAELFHNINATINRAENAFPDRRFVVLLAKRLSETQESKYRLEFSTRGYRLGYYYDADQYFLYCPIADVPREVGDEAQVSPAAVPSRVSSFVPSSKR